MRSQPRIAELYRFVHAGLLDVWSAFRTGLPFARGKSDRSDAGARTARQLARLAQSLVLILLSGVSTLVCGQSSAPVAEAASSSSGAQAQNSVASPDLVVAPVVAADRVALKDHHPAWASIENDRGAVPVDLPLEHLELVLARPPQVQQAFDELLREQLDPASPNFHHWLTPVELGLRFGPSQHDLDAITIWLRSQSLRVDSVANSRVRVQFSGTASAVGNAFGSEMHYYLVDGEQRLSIAAEPQIPAALAGIIKSVSGLFTINYQASYEMTPALFSADGVQGVIGPNLTLSSGAHIVSPADFATIYDLNAAGATGAGQTIAVIGRARVNPADITNFQTLTGVTFNLPTVIIPVGGMDPGPPQTAPPTSGSASGDQGEATLDVTRAGSIAPGATLDLVVSTSASGGIVIASQYVVDTNPVPAHVMTVSFSGCESSAGPSEAAFWDSLWSSAAAEGISVFVASGDSGAAGCDQAFTTPPASQTASINVICASSHVTCVGGTEFADASNPTQYWSSTSNQVLESALGYIPEGGWNEPLNSSSQPQVAGSGGGVSAFIPTPSWQTGTGVPGTQGRYVPDIAFSASRHDGYFGCFAAAQANSCVVQTGGTFPFLSFSGTSASAPSMAGIAALLNQKTGALQGELNSNLYRLFSIPGVNVFHDVTVVSSGVSSCDVTVPSMCNNSTSGPVLGQPGLSGYLVAAGYDEVTGLGSIDVTNLVTNWSDNPLPSISSFSPTHAPGGAPVSLTINGASFVSGATVSFGSNSGIVPSSVTAGTVTVTIPAADVATSGTPAVKVTNPAPGGGTGTATTNFTVDSYTVGVTGANSATQPAGTPATFSIAVAPTANGFPNPVMLSASGLPAAASATFSQNPVTPNGATQNVTMTVNTTARSAVPQAPRAPARPLGFQVALWMLTTMLSLAGFAMFGRGCRTGRWATVLPAALLFASLVFAAGCGANYGSSGGGPTGTPAGTSTITVTAASGTMAQTTTVTLTVN